MISNFDACLAIILKEEGGNDDDPQDHGGRTSRGIIQREWDAYRRTHPGLPEDVWQAPQQDINNIYKTQYWNPYCDNMPAGLDLVFFNASVNSGRQQAVKELQRALGVEADGMMGMVTMQSIDACSNLPALIHACCENRRKFYRALKQFPRYGKGWLARTDRVESAAIEMAPTPSVTGIADTMTFSAKAAPEDRAQPPVSVQTATGGTAAATVGSGVSDQLQQISGQLQPLQDTFHWIKVICIIIGLACAGLAIYAVIHNKRTQAVT